MKITIEIPKLEEESVLTRVDEGWQLAAIYFHMEKTTFRLEKGDNSELLVINKKARLY